ncbi:hypothetical protein KCU70_g241, partial [Aureobasidium melanogenum]
MHRFLILRSHSIECILQILQRSIQVFTFPLPVRASNQSSWRVLFQPSSMWIMMEGFLTPALTASSTPLRAEDHKLAKDVKLAIRADVGKGHEREINAASFESQKRGFDIIAKTLQETRLRAGLYIPQSYGVHPAVTKDVLGRPGGITLRGVLVSDIAELQDMQRRQIKALIEERVDSLILGRFGREGMVRQRGPRKVVESISRGNTWPPYTSSNRFQNMGHGAKGSFPLSEYAFSFLLPLIAQTFLHFSRRQLLKSRGEAMEGKRASCTALPMLDAGKRTEERFIVTWCTSRHHRRREHRDGNHGDLLYHHLCSWHQQPPLLLPGPPPWLGAGTSSYIPSQLMHLIRHHAVVAGVHISVETWGCWMVLGCSNFRVRHLASAAAFVASVASWLGSCRLCEEALLSHHGRAHVVASHTGRAALLHTALLAGVEATLLAAEALFLEAAVVAVILVTAQITSGLSLLDFNVFAQDLQGTFESSVDGSLTVKVASRTRPNCMKKFLKSASVASCETPPTKILLVRSCSSRGIALLGSICGMVSCGHDGHGRKTHDLAVKLVFLHHDDVDGLRVSESEETESARTSSCTITHDSALRDFAELIAQELGLLTICCLPVQTTDEHFAVKNSQRHDCAEEQAIFFEFPECLVQNPGSRTRSFALIVKTAVGNASDRTAEQDQVQVEFLNPCLQGHNKAVQAYMLVASRLAVILVICWHSRLPTLQAPANSSAHHVLYMRYFLRWGHHRQLRHDSSAEQHHSRYLGSGCCCCSPSFAGLAAVVRSDWGTCSDETGAGAAAGAAGAEGAASSPS